VSSESNSISALLTAWNAGDEKAGREVVSTLYQEFRRLAATYLRQERTDHTLQPTALVHELYLKLFSGQPVEWHNRNHFFAVAARQLRHIVVDYAREQHAQKRGGGQAKLSIDQVQQFGITLDNGVIELDQALERLEQQDQRVARVIELRYFGGLTEAEVATTLDISVATVKRDWEFGRTWLLKELG
jgi:RNA polymerase sigma-70 factor, ECF subfamily